MIHYHGTPITPRANLLELAGRSFCVSYAEPRDTGVCHEIGQSVMLDNGAYTHWRQGAEPDWEGYARWVRPWLDYQTTWAIMPDVITGTEADQARLSVWMFHHAPDVWRRCAPVWHMHESIERLNRLCHTHDRVCIGSSGEYAKIGTTRWTHRMDDAFNAICPTGPPPTWLHMLRAMAATAGKDWPFASADSTNVAQNHAGNNTRATAPKDPNRMAAEIDGRQTPARWRRRERTLELSIEQGAA